MTNKSTEESWPKEYDNALLATLGESHASAESFMAAYRAKSGDDRHGAGGVGFRAIQFVNLRLAEMTAALRKDIARLGEEERAKKKAEHDSATNSTTAAAVLTPDGIEYHADGKTYVGSQTAANLMGCSRSKFYDAYASRCGQRAGLDPKRVTTVFYDRADVEKIAAGLRAPPAKREEKIAVPTTVPAAEKPITQVWITSAEVAAILGCTTMQVRNYFDRLVIQRGKHLKHKSEDRRMFDRASAVALATALRSEGQTPPLPKARHGAVSRERCIIIDGVAYVGTLEAARLLGNATKVPNRLRREVTPKYGLDPSMPPSVPLYDRAEVVAVAKKVAAEAAEALVCETAPGEVLLRGETCVEPRRAGEILGLDPRAVGTKYGHRVERRYHPKSDVMYYTRASIDAIQAERDAEAAKKAADAKASATVTNGGTTSTEVPATHGPTNGSAPASKMAPVKHLRDMSLMEKLDAVNRALAQGVITEHDHANKVRVIAAGGA